MRKTILILACLATAIFYSSCTSQGNNDPETIGKEVFQILKKINRSTHNEYYNYFISIEELRRMARNPEVITSESARNEITSMIKEELNGLYKTYFYEIKDKGRELNITWEKIEYLDYGYEFIDEDGMTGIKGSLYL